MGIIIDNMNTIAITIGAVGSLAVILTFIWAIMKKQPSYQCIKQEDISKMQSKIDVHENQLNNLEGTITEIKNGMAKIFDELRKVYRDMPKRDGDPNRSGD